VRHCVSQQVLPDVLKDHGAFTFRDKQSSKKSTVLQNNRNYRETTVSQPKELNSQQHCLRMSNHTHTVSLTAWSILEWTRHSRLQTSSLQWQHWQAVPVVC
jgi:hypothetical protein